MHRESSPLDTIRIASPCTAQWEAMSGDDRTRHCTDCDLNVYNIAEMTRAEAEALITGTEGRLCVLLYRRNDGTILTRDCPVKARRVRGVRRLRRAAALSILVGGMMSFEACRPTPPALGGLVAMPYPPMDSSSLHSAADSMHVAPASHPEK